MCRWEHLSLCILDATYSINARYGSVMAPLRRYAEWVDLQKVLLRGDEPAVGTPCGTRRRFGDWSGGSGRPNERALMALHVGLPQCDSKEDGLS
jgi:hypothetical protein